MLDEMGWIRWWVYVLLALEWRRMFEEGHIPVLADWRI